MRYILLMKATRHSEAGVRPSRERLEAMNAYREELARAGVLLAAERLYPSSSGLRLSYRSPAGRPAVAAGPLEEVNELVAGYMLIDVKTEEEAVAWALRAPDPHGYGEGAVELRRLYDSPEPPASPFMHALEDELRSQTGLLKKKPKLFLK